MTKILIGEDFCEISGHAPDPVVCHGISAISQMVGNYLERGGLGTVEISSGYMKITQNSRCRQTEGIGILLGAAYRAFLLNNTPFLMGHSSEKKSTLADADAISPIAGRYWIASYVPVACFMNPSFPCDVAHFLKMGIKMPPVISDWWY